MSFPIEHLSYSSLSLLCSNPWLFRKKYILGLFDMRTSPSAMIGSAAHRYAETRLKNGSIDEAYSQALSVIDSYNPNEIEWGSFTREKIEGELKTSTASWEMYKPQLDGYKVINTEVSHIASPKIEGVSFPLPLKAVTDLVLESPQGDIHIVDWKFTRSFTNAQIPQPNKIVQSIFNYYTIADLYKAPVYFDFVELKRSASKTGNQSNVIRIDYHLYGEYFLYFIELYSRVLTQLMSPDFQYLPNFMGMDAKQTWDDFVLSIEQGDPITV